MKRWHQLLFAIFGLILIITAWQRNQEPYWLHDISLSSRQEAALTFYDQVWGKLKSLYLDSSLNHQNWDYWRTRYGKNIQTMQDAYVAVQTMITSLNDPYTRLLVPEKATQQNLDIQARIFGVGMHLTPHNLGAKVVSVIDSSPALKAGIKPQDLVLKVNNEPIAHIDIEKIVEKIRGPKGTWVTLLINRNNTLHAFHVQRDEIKIQSVFYKLLPHKIAYIRLSTFMSERATEELRNALEKAEQTTNGLILDIRENFGGLFSNAQDIADMFLSSGRIVSVVDRQGGKEDFYADNNTTYNKPVVLLIDGGSASASEILSGALKENKRALLIGQKTFGKGLVQKIMNLPDGAELNMTIAKYLTPEGHDINKVGIKPDIETPVPLITANTRFVDKTLERAQAVLYQKTK